MSTIPLLLCGKSPTLAKTFTASLETLSKDYKSIYSSPPLPLIPPSLFLLSPPPPPPRLNLANASSSPPLKVVHVCHDLPSSKREINALLRGEPVTPESGLGTNAEKGVATVVPKGIVIGKGFSEEEIGELRSSCVGEGRKVVAWLVSFWLFLVLEFWDGGGEKCCLGGGVSVY